MRIEQRSDAAEFFDLVAHRRGQFGDNPRLVIRETVFRRQWRVEASIALVPAGLAKIHELKLIHPAGHYLAPDDTNPAEAWPTHSVAIAEVRDIVPILRAGADVFGLDVDEELEVTASVLVECPDMSVLLGNAPGRRLARAVAWSKREVA